MMSQTTLIIVSRQTSGAVRPLWLSLTQIHKHRILRLSGIIFYKIKTGFAAKTAGAGRLRLRYSLRRVHIVALPATDDWYKSLCTCSEDRKYLAGASGIKIADNEQPLP